MTSPSVRPGRPGNRETGHSVTSPSGIWKGQTGGQGAAGWLEAGTAQHGGLGAGAGSTRAPPRARRPPQLGHGARQCCQSQGLVPAVGPSPSSVPPHPLACGALGRLPPEPGATSVLLALVLWNQGPAQGVWRRPWRIERQQKRLRWPGAAPPSPSRAPALGVSTLPTMSAKGAAANGPTLARLSPRAILQERSGSKAACQTPRPRSQLPQET